MLKYQSNLFPFSICICLVRLVLTRGCFLELLVDKFSAKLDHWFSNHVISPHIIGVLLFLFVDWENTYQKAYYEFSNSLKLICILLITISSTNIWKIVLHVLQEILLIWATKVFLVIVLFDKTTNAVLQLLEIERSWSSESLNL